MRAQNTAVSPDGTLPTDAAPYEPLDAAQLAAELDGVLRGAAGGEGGSGAGAPVRASGAGGAGVASTRPRLIGRANPCRGYFPAQAHSDHAVVRVRVRVDAAGRPCGSSLLDEAAASLREFVSAANACAAALRFTPALDVQGTAVASDATLELRFDRS